MKTASISLALGMAVLGCGDGTADATAPVLTLVGNDQIEVAFGAVFEDLGAVANDDIDGELPVSVEGAVDTMAPGTYTLTYTATDSDGQVGTASREVVVLEDETLDSAVSTPANPVTASFFDGRLCEADYWSEQPVILSAGLGFSDIIGIPEPEMTEELALAAGGAWSNDIDCGNDQQNYTSTSLQDQVAQAYLLRTPYGELKDGALGLDGLPIVFSWPVDGSSIDLADFQVTLNTGDIVRPHAVSTFPNFECNERNTLPIFGEFGNRLPSDHPDSRYPAFVRIVGDLFLVGPGGEVVNARGLAWENTSSPYDANNGPRFVGAKLNRVEGPMVGEGAGPIPANDAWTLYGDEANFMVRTLSTGGVSPNGTSGVTPDDFERFFRLHATGADGNPVVIDTAGVDVPVQGGVLRVLGLSDLGQPASEQAQYDACYDEDLDNYIDIVLAGDEAAARSITHVEVPSLEGGYDAFYNPGGPGRTPFDGVTYTEPGPGDLEPVIVALDDPMRVSYDPGETTPVDGLQTLDVDGVEREYLLTVPDSDSSSEPVPLLFNFHQLQGTAEQQLADSGLEDVARGEGFILVTPQAVGGVWSVTGFPLTSGADDLGFVNAMIDELSTTYAIDPNRIYATGMSQGGFLSFDLACNFSETFAAIAPVSGVMTPAMTDTCAPVRHVPVLQTHGTADALIAYDGSQTAIQWWVDFNGASPTPEIVQLPDPFPDNATSVDRLVYAGSDVDVVHLRVNGGGHVWPGADGDSEIDMAAEIWGFLSQYDLNGRID